MYVCCVESCGNTEPVGLYSHNTSCSPKFYLYMYFYSGKNIVIQVVIASIWFSLTCLNKVVFNLYNHLEAERKDLIFIKIISEVIKQN